MGTACLSADHVGLGANLLSGSTSLPTIKKDRSLMWERPIFFLVGRGERMGTACLSADHVGLGANLLSGSTSLPTIKKDRSLMWERPIFFLVGRGERIRTSDPHNPIVVRYQAALRPDVF